MLLQEIKNQPLTEAFVYVLSEDRISFLYDKNKEKLTDRFNNDNLVPANLKSRLGTGDVAKNIIGYFAEIDPTSKKIYVQWMLKIYMGGLKLEDFYKLKEGLAKFDKFKSKIDKKDINQYKSINNLLDVTDEFELDDSASKREDTSKMKNDGVEWVVNTPNFKILIPKTFEASCLYGANTRWCTISKNDSSHFDRYSAQGPLYIIMAGSGDNVKKFQLHYESDQFLDASDDEVSETDIAMLSKHAQYKDFLNMLIKKHYGKYFK